MNKKITHTRNLSTRTSLQDSDFSDFQNERNKLFIGQTDSFVIQKSFDNILIRENLVMRPYQAGENEILSKMNENFTQIGSLRTTSNRRNCNCSNGCDQKNLTYPHIHYKITDEDKLLLQIDDIAELKSISLSQNVIKV